MRASLLQRRQAQSPGLGPPAALQMQEGPRGPAGAALLQAQGASGRSSAGLRVCDSFRSYRHLCVRSKVFFSLAQHAGKLDQLCVRNVANIMKNCAASRTAQAWLPVVLSMDTLLSAAHYKQGNPSGGALGAELVAACKQNAVHEGLPVADLRRCGRLQPRHGACWCRHQGLCCRHQGLCCRHGTARLD